MIGDTKITSVMNFFCLYHTTQYVANFISRPGGRIRVGESMSSSGYFDVHHKITHSGVKLLYYNSHAYQSYQPVHNKSSGRIVSSVVKWRDTSIFIPRIESFNKLSQPERVKCSDWLKK